MTSASLLSSDDNCRRAAFYSQRWEPNALFPKDILARAVDHGLISESDDAAADFAMQLCVERVIDTAETDLLGVAAHIASLADLLAWLLRGPGGPWMRPQPVLGLWHSGAFLSADERSLRSVALVSRFDGLTEMELRHSWPVRGECAAYQVPMDVLVVVLGSLRAGRWTNSFTAGWRHPVAKTLRLRKRDGESFSGAWERVFREKDEATREEWLDAMTDDGVLAESIHVLHVDVPTKDRMSQVKLERIMATTEPPEMQPSRCFDRVRPCPFRSCCPQGKEPSEEAGFISLP